MSPTTYTPLTLEESARRKFGWGWLVIASILTNCFFAYSLLQRPPYPSVAYSPVQGIVNYKARIFNRGFGADLPIYEQPPSEKVDEAWKALTQYGFSKITRDEATQMANKTYPLAQEEGYYMSGLDVFHQLHCLDMLRMSLYPASYPHMIPSTSPLRLAHLAHCVGHVRQALMCSADITPIVWQWDAEGGLVRRRDDTPHTCKNFEQIQEWAKERYAFVDDDSMKVYVEDDL